jgi:hypothetical protein
MVIVEPQNCDTCSYDPNWKRLDFKSIRMTHVCLQSKDVSVNNVDDGIFMITEDQKTIAKVLDELEQQQLDFDEVVSLMDYLDVHVGESTIPGTIELTQLDLIKILGLTNANSISTPAEKALRLMSR